MLSKQQFHLLFFVGAMICIPLVVGGTLYRQIHELSVYSEKGYYYSDCNPFVLADLEFCKTDNINLLIFQTVITSGVTTSLLTILYKTRDVLSMNVPKKSNLQVIDPRQKKCINVNCNRVGVYLKNGMCIWCNRKLKLLDRFGISTNGDIKID